MGKKKREIDLNKVVIAGEVVILAGAGYLTYRLVKEISEEVDLTAIKIALRLNSEADFVNYYFNGDWDAYQAWKDRNGLGEWLYGVAFKPRIRGGVTYADTPYKQKRREQIMSTTEEVEEVEKEQTETMELYKGATLKKKPWWRKIFNIPYEPRG